MELSTKWYDLLIAGGLFWLPQLYVIATFGFLPKFDELKTLLTGLSDPVATLLSTAVIALATLVILITGSIWDLLTSGVPFRELPIFYRHLLRNKDWVEKALQKYSPYVQDDYKNLRNILKPDGSYADERLYSGKLWSKTARESNRFFETGRKNALSAFNRLYMLILVKALSKSGKEAPELLVGPLQSWRLARLLAIILFFLATEILSISGARLMVNSASLQDATITFILLAVLYLAVIFLVIGFTERGFDRVCVVLFSLWYNFENSEEQTNEFRTQLQPETKQTPSSGRPETNS